MLSLYFALRNNNFACTEETAPVVFDNGMIAVVSYASFASLCFRSGSERDTFDQLMIHDFVFTATSLKSKYQ